MRSVFNLATVVIVLGLLTTPLTWAELEAPANAGIADPAAAEGQARQSSEETTGKETEETPEIEVEVIGKKWGEQVVPALVPSTGEVVSAISSEEIENLGEQTVVDTIAFLPGVQVVRQGRKFERLVFVRGGFVPTVLIDGAQISAASGGFNSGFANRALYSIPLSAIERIEVIRSSSSLIYGPQALAGGVINLVTKNGNPPSRVELSVEAGSYGNWRETLSHFNGNEKRGVAFVAEREIGDSDLEFGGKRLDHLFLKTNRTFDNGDALKFFALNTDGSRRLDVWSQEFQEVAHRGPVYWSFDPWHERLASLSYSHNLKAPGAGLDLVLWTRDRKYRNLYWEGPISPRPGSDLYNDTEDDSIGASFFWRQPAGANHLLRSGAQWYRLNGFEQDTAFDASTGLPVPKPRTPTDYELTGYFLQDEWTLGPKTQLFWGGRYETPKDRDDALVYSLGLERELARETRCYARFGTGVEFPTYDQLASDPTLEDRESQNLDVGVDHRFGDSLAARIGYFRIAIQNDFITYLRPDGDPANSSDYLTTQADQTTYGYELELQGGSRRLQWFTNWTRLARDVARTPEIGGQPLQLAIPPDSTFNFGVRWSPRERTKVSISHRHVSHYIARARYFSGGWPIDAYSVSNLSASHEFGDGWSLRATVDNLFDEDYETQPGYPMPGRNYCASVAKTIVLD